MSQKTSQAKTRDDKEAQGHLAEAIRCARRAQEVFIRSHRRQWNPKARDAALRVQHAITMLESVPLVEISSDAETVSTRTRDAGVD